MKNEKTLEKCHLRESCQNLIIKNYFSSSFFGNNKLWSPQELSGFRQFVSEVPFFVKQILI